jgi:hypothetical protein
MAQTKTIAVPPEIQEWARAELRDAEARAIERHGSDPSKAFSRVAFECGHLTGALKDLVRGSILIREAS